MATPPSLPSTPLQSPRSSNPSKGPVSRASIDSVLSSQSHQEYLNSLVPPTEEQFAHIAEVQAEREAEHKRHYREQQRQSLEVAARPAPEPRPQSRQSGSHVHLYSRLGFGRRTSTGDEGLRTKAATVIQRTYRGYRARREMKGLGIDASTRWVHAIREAQWRELTTPRARSSLADDRLTPPGSPPGSGVPGSRPATARQNWKKVSAIARRAGGDLDADTSSSSSSASSSDSDSGDRRKTAEQKKQEQKRREEAKAYRKQAARMMGLQYFLEMVDLKHRYGANLRVYHEEWKKADTKENFFYWLDYGEGRFIDIEACPRERLDREQVRYLSREERQYYLVKVDEEGRLCWAKNGARIDTSEKWKDSIHGIVPSDDPTPAYAPVSENQTALLDRNTTSSSRSSSSSPRSSISPRSSLSSLDRITAARYASDSPPGTGTANNPLTKKIKHVSATTILNNLLRKTVRKNTWIFVADTSFRLYVGIKNSGAFQHSSFLQGSRISAAGLIRIKDGRLKSLSPLSGHYRPPASNFRAFVRSLKEAGVDMRRVSVSKSYAVLVGLEVYVKTRKRVREVVEKMKHGVNKKGDNDGVVIPSKMRRAAEPIGENNEGEGQDKGKDKERDTVEKGALLTKEAGTAAGVAGSGQQKQEAKMMEENQLAVEVMQKLNLGAGLREPKGQKGDGDREEAAPIVTPPT
ncbi:IQ domain-containing protein IQM6 [Madurella fahalii]|uniref:IQ domain-containing protein IQM6 n=1 Tax=Madurella fahalii TaxID=1157608 RepID=A0ABQ0FX19_9PEZI